MKYSVAFYNNTDWHPNAPENTIEVFSLEDVAKLIEAAAEERQHPQPFKKIADEALVSFGIDSSVSVESVNEENQTITLRFWGRVSTKPQEIQSVYKLVNEHTILLAEGDTTHSQTTIPLVYNGEGMNACIFFTTVKITDPDEILGKILFKLSGLEKTVLEQILAP